MARNESDREDLLREATALVRRAELQASGFAEPVVIGFRRDGAGSVYFGADPVVQFNSQLEFRRGYLHGTLLKADRGTLAELTRFRTPSAVELRRRDLSPGETTKILAELQQSLDQLAADFLESRFQLIGQVPPDPPAAPSFLDDCLAWLRSLPRPLVIASSPRVG